MLVTRFLGRDRDVAVADGLRVLQALDWTAGLGDPGAPAILTYLPDARANPYQSLLYCRLHESGIRPVPGYDVHAATRLAHALQGGPHLVVHLHWLNIVTAKVADEAAAVEQVNVFVSHLRGMVDVGARLVWTVHNVLPHDSRFPEVDALLRREVVALSERVHVMSPRTLEMVAPYFVVPSDKVIDVPHPSYDDHYPSFLSRAMARQELGIPDDVVVHLIVGALKPYKGLADLAVAFDDICRREPGRHALVVAGAPDNSSEAKEFSDWAAMNPNVLAALGKIPAEHMQVYLRSADLAVFPYRRSLNSGALALTCTFGLPAVITSAAGDADGTDPEWAEVYEPGLSPAESLADAMLAASRRLVSATARERARTRADAVTPPAVSRAFGQALRTWLNAPRRS